MARTVRELAARAGVSPATVSRVLNNTGDAPVSAEIRERVEAAVRETGYQHEPRNRKGARAEPANPPQTEAPRVGYLILELEQKYTHPYFSRLLQGIESEASHLGMTLAFTEPASRFRAEPSLFGQELTEVDLDGLILVSAPRALQEIARAHVPHVVLADAFTGWSEAEGIDRVGFDHAQAAATAVRHLIGLGHRRIAFVGDTRHDLRFAGYRSALAEGGLPYDKRLVQPCSFALTAGYEETARLLAGAPDLTAVVAACDTIAIGAMRAVHESGRRVGEQVRVVGIDDIEMAAFTTPPLTTVRVYKEEIGRWAVRLLGQRLQRSGAVPVSLTLPTELVVRSS